MILLTEPRAGKKFILDSNSIRYTLPSKLKLTSADQKGDQKEEGVDWIEVDITLIFTSIPSGESSSVFECVETAEEILALHKTATP